MTMAEPGENAHPESSEIELKIKSQSQEEEQERQQGGGGGGEKAPSKWDQLPGELPRKEKRKAMKRAKRKQARKEAAQKERAEEEVLLNDPARLLTMEAEQQAEAEAQEKARLEFEERERIWLQNHQRAIEEAERKRQEHLQRKLVEEAAKKEEDENWEYVEDGPAEIIWQGNEIIVQKKKIRVPRRRSNVNITEKDSNQPISNPLPPQHAVFEAHKKQESSTTGLKLFDGVEQQIPNFGTEQDKAHCPFHIKTGACRFGSRCSRAHFYPNKSCTLLMKNMYNGPGLACEQEEGLEYTDEEVGQHYDEFYEDVHTEFLKFGELVNFKVCKNSSSHLRGNVYVHYQSLDSAVAAYNATNGRYFAGKQITCEFVGVTRWKVAICGEYLKSRHKNCSHGSACNFLHCFRNPGGEYDWADWDSPPPRSWVIKMDMLFGGSMVDRHDYRKPREQDSPHRHGHSDRRIKSRRGYKSSSRRHKSHERDSWSCDDRERTPIRDHSSGSKYGSEEEREQRSDMDQTKNTYKRRENQKSCSLSRGSTGKSKRGDDEISEEERLMHRPKRTKHQRGHASEDDKRKSVFGADMDAAVKKQSRRERESHIQYESDDDRGKLNSKNGETRERGDAKSSRRARYQLEAAGIEQKKINLSRRGHHYSHSPGKHKDHTRELENICEEKFQLSRRCHGHSHSPCEHKDDRKKLRRQRYSKSPRRNSHCASPRGDRDWSMSPKRREHTNKLLRRSRDLSKTPKRSSDEGSFDSLHRWQASDDTEF